VQLHKCTLLSNYYVDSFRETAPRKTTENTVKHQGGGVGLVVANHRDGGGNLVVITTLPG